MREVTYTTIDVARTIVLRCSSKKYDFCPMKLEKMMVIAYGEHLVKTGERLFNSTISVNKQGIYIKDIRKNYRQYIKHEFFGRGDKMYLCSEETMFRRIIEEYGKNDFYYIYTDPRIQALEQIKRWNNRLTDDDILNVFTTVKKRPMHTPILCGACEKAKSILNACFYAGYEINTYKLQKLLFLAYGECLVKTGTKLFSEEIKIYETGPIVKEVEMYLLPYDVSGFYSPLKEWQVYLITEKEIIDNVVKKYGKLSSDELDDLSQLKFLMSRANSKGFVSDEDIKIAFA